jgi:type IV pilus assembly protein PilQ
LRSSEEQDQTVLSKRGSVVPDERSNKIFVNDIPSRLEDMRRLIAEIDVEQRQVLIEAQIVEATDTFARNLGVRLGFGSKSGGRLGTTDGGVPVYRTNIGGGLAGTGYQAGQIETKPNFFTDALALNLPASNINAKQAGALSFALWNSAATRYIDLEVSALEATDAAKVVSRPRVMTADKAEALIEQGRDSVPDDRGRDAGFHGEFQEGQPCAQGKAADHAGWQGHDGHRGQQGPGTL